MQDQNSLLNSDAYCPSFNCYSSDHKLANIASNVCEEFDNLDFESSSSSDEFEFVSLYRTGDDANVFNGAQIGPVFPVFNRDLQLDHEKDEVAPERSSCSSSSEADELEGIPEGTYCVWTPKGGVSETTPSRCKKCNSTGSSSSKRWKYLKELLKRSNSDGNKSIVFLTPLSSSSKKMEEKIGKLDINFNKEKKSSSSDINFNKEKKSSSSDINFNKEKKSSSSVNNNGGSNSKVAGKAKNGNKKLMAAHKAFYGSRKEGDYKRRTSYLPYRQDLIGFFASVNTMPRTFPHAL